MCHDDHRHEHHRHEHHRHEHQPRGHNRSFHFEVNGEEIEARVRDAMQRAERHLEKNIKPAMKHVRRHMRDMDIDGIVNDAMSRAGMWAVGEAPPQPSPTYAEERMTILRLVQEGKVTAEEAARLLDALG